MNKKLKKARDKVDQLDNKIFILIKKRTNVVKQMLKLKKYKKQIIDHKRINQILKKITAKSKKIILIQKLRKVYGNL